MTLAAALLGALFEGARAQGLAYCVLRNYETLPDRVPGSDVDLLVAARERTPFEDLIAAEAARAGWTLERRFRKSYRITHLRFVAGGPDGEYAVLRFDVMSHVGLGPVRFIDGRDILGERRRAGAVYAPAPAMEQTVNLLNALYNERPLKARYRDAARALAGAGADLESCLAHYLGRPLAAAVIARLALAREAELGSSARARLRRRDWGRRPLGALWDRVDLLVARLGRILAPPGTMAVLLGPDGVGKSTIARAVAGELSAAFPAVHVAHLRPGLLPEMKRLLGRRRSVLAAEAPNPPAPVPRRPGTLGSLARLAYYGVDYTLGYWLRIRPRLARGELVLFDRYFFDYFVDQQQKAVALPAGLIRLACAFYPAPDRAFVLAATPESVHARRADLDAREIARQTRGFESLARWYPYLETVAADGAPETVARAVARGILGLAATPP